MRWRAARPRQAPTGRCPTRLAAGPRGGPHPAGAPQGHAAAAGPPPGRARAREAALRGKRVAVLSPAAYGGYKDANEAWIARALNIRGWPPAEATGAEVRAVLEDLREAWAERVAIMMADGGLPRADAERLAWEWLSPLPELDGRFPVALEKFWAVRQPACCHDTRLSHLSMLLTS